MYFDGEPTQAQTIVPVVESKVGVMVTVTACPVLVEAVLPRIVIVPPSFTLPPEILPTTETVRPTPGVPVLLGSVWNFSATAVRKPLAASISSDTLARTV